MPDEEIADVILDSVQGPKKATGDSGSAEKFPISELIEADRYLAGKNRSGIGIKFNKIVPSGGTGE